jgi:NAD(P)-dependent dehydrogenase (short-subunit alcohol dehydrogenase family)
MMKVRAHSSVTSDKRSGAMRLAEKVIIVTGSTTGIGECIAETCVAEGARVIVHGRNVAAGEEIAERLGRDSAVFVAGDLGTFDTVSRLVKAAIESFGRIDGLVNNAAWIPKGNMHTTTLEQWNGVLMVNLTSAFLLIKTALPELVKSSGSVVNIGSINAYAGEPDLLAYSVSKGGLTTLTRNLGDVLHAEHGVRVNQVSPGWVLTKNEIEKKKEHGLPEDWYEKVHPFFAPSGRIMDPSTIAHACTYFLGDESRPVSGQEMVLEQYPMVGRNPRKDIFE